MLNFLTFLSQYSYSSSGSGGEAAAGIAAAIISLWAGMGLFMIVIYLVALLTVLAMFILRIYLKWKILERAGMSPWLALLAIVPIGSLIVEFILAFGDWPNLKPTVSKK